MTATRKMASGIAGFVLLGSFFVTSLPASAAPMHNCHTGYVCLYTQTGYHGRILSLGAFGARSLEKYPFPGGGTWRDKAASIFNNKAHSQASLRNTLSDGRRVAIAHPTSGHGNNVPRTGDFIDIIKR